VDALSDTLTWKLKLGTVAVKVPLTVPVPLLIASVAGRAPFTALKENGATPPEVEQVTVYCDPTSVVPDAEQLIVGAATMLPRNCCVLICGVEALSLSCSV